MQMKADIDSAVEKVAKRVATQAKPTLVTDTDTKADTIAAAEDVTSRPSEPTIQTPSSGTGAASDTVDVEITNTAGNVPRSLTETWPGPADDVSSSFHCV